MSTHVRSSMFTICKLSHLSRFEMFTLLIGTVNFRLKKWDFYKSFNQI